MRWRQASQREGFHCQPLGRSGDFWEVQETSGEPLGSLWIALKSCSERSFWKVTREIVGRFGEVLGSPVSFQKLQRSLAPQATCKTCLYVWLFWFLVGVRPLMACSGYCEQPSFCLKGRERGGPWGRKQCSSKVQGSDIREQKQTESDKKIAEILLFLLF